MARFYKSAVFAVTLLLTSAALHAQTRISGTVTDYGGQPVVGVTVMVSGTTTGTQTDLDGNWSLQLDDPQSALLQFTCLGYETVEERVRTRAVINVVLHESSEFLDELVVVGYGTQKKVNLTGSVSTVSMQDLGENRTIISAASALTGLVPGMTVMQTSGEPGVESTSMNIRGVGSFTSGASSPYVLIDGVRGSLNTLNPSDIESISVLKDAASTSIYGTRAANGVILVTTKKGSEGKPMVSYSFSGVFQTPYTRLDFVDDYVTYMEYINERGDVRNVAHEFSDTSIELWKYAAEHPNELNEYGMPNYMAYPSTDLWDALFNTGFTQEHQLSISGGSKTVHYAISARYLDNSGIMRHDGLDTASQTASVTANIEADVTKWFTVGNKFYGQFKSIGAADTSMAFNINCPRTPCIYVGEPGKWGYLANTEDNTDVQNPFYEISNVAGYNYTYNISETLYAEIRPYKGLSFEAKFNYSPTFQRTYSYTPHNVYWDYRTNTQYSENQLEDATAKEYHGDAYDTSIDLIGRYETTIRNDHFLGVMVGYSTMVSKSEGSSFTRKGATDWTMHDMNTYSTLYDSSVTSPYGWALRSYFARVNYALMDRYLFEANVRIDGSSRFGTSTRYGVFPSFSAGWKINEEKWMESASGWLSQLKLRVSWGQTGNDTGIGNYDWQATYTLGDLVINGVDNKGLYVATSSNVNLKWETTSSTDVGIDAGFFNQRLTADIDYYYKNTRDILYTPSTYLTMGNLSAVPENLGRMWNQGIELALNWKDQVGGFFYYAGINFSYNKNLVTKFKGKLEEGWVDGEFVSNVSDVQESWGGGVIQEGHTIGEHYIYKRYHGTGAGYSGSGEVDINAGPKDGMIRTESDMAWVRAMIDAGYTFRGETKVDRPYIWYGDFIYADRDGDGNYGSTHDRYFTGHSATPAYNLGITFGLSWKGIDFSMIWAGAFDYYLLYNTQYYNTSTAYKGGYANQKIIDDHYFYDPDNPTDSRTKINATYPRLGTTGDDLDFYYYKSDYLKLKNVTIGYTLPEKITRKFYVKQLKFYVSGENLLTITKYPGEDPEIGPNINYPLMRQYTIGAQITF